MSRRFIITFAAVVALLGASGMATSAHASVDAPPATPGGVSLTGDQGSIRPADHNKGVSLTDDDTYVDITKYCHYVKDDYSVTLRCRNTPVDVNVWVEAVCSTRADLPPVLISTDPIRVGPLNMGSRTATCPKQNGYTLEYVQGIATERR